MPNVALTTPMYAARYLSSTLTAMMMNAPVMTPPPPSPLTTRPRINTSPLLAAPQMTLPTSKMTTVSRNTGFSGKYWYALPQTSLNDELVTEYADPYQAMLAMDPNSVVMAGMAVAMMEKSSAASRMLSMRPSVRRTRRRPLGCWYCGVLSTTVAMGVVSDESCLVVWLTAGVRAMLLRVWSSIASDAMVGVREGSGPA